MSKQGKYDNTLKGISADDNGSLKKSGEVILSIGDRFQEKMNPHITYEYTHGDLHFLNFSGSHGGGQRQTVRFLNDELRWNKIQ